MKIACDIDEVIVPFTQPYFEFCNPRLGTQFRAEDAYTYDLWEVMGVSKERALELADEFYESEEFANLEPLHGAEQGLEKLAKKHNILIVTSRPVKIKKLPKNLLSPQQAVAYSPQIFSSSKTGNFSLQEKTIGFFRAQKSSGFLGFKSAAASCGVLNPDLKIKKQTENFFKKYFPQLNLEVFFCGDMFQIQGKTKAELCEEFNRTCVIDDSRKHATECAEKGMLVLLMDYRWNRNKHLHENMKRVYNWREILHILNGNPESE